MSNRPMNQKQRKGCQLENDGNRSSQTLPTPGDAQSQGTQKHEEWRQVFNGGIVLHCMWVCFSSCHPIPCIADEHKQSDSKEQGSPDSGNPAYPFRGFVTSFINVRHDRSSLALIGCWDYQSPTSVILFFVSLLNSISSFASFGKSKKPPCD
jgi:hypothetical protein